MPPSRPQAAQDLPVVVLCGGRGMRLGHMTADRPKPLVELGGRPILEHILYLFYSQGVREAHLAVGYQKEALEAWLAAHAGALERLGLALSSSDAGISAPTGDRLARAAEELQGRAFFAAYGDCLADVDLEQLWALHRRHGRLLTLTCVRPLSPFGVVTVADADRVTSMTEKPPMSEWVNGGFFVCEPEVWNRHRPGESFEQGALPRLVAESEATGLRLSAFWGCMDTPKDVEALDQLCRSGSAPWPVPPGPPDDWPPRAAGGFA